MTLWVCRAGSSGEYENYFLEKQVIAVTWSKIESDMTSYNTWDKFKEALSKIYPDESKGAISNYAGQLFPFFQTMEIGEKVLLPSKIKPGVIYVGTIKSECTYLPNSMPYSHIRKVEWSEETILRKNLDSDILHSLGAYLTIFRIDEEKEKRIFSTGSKKKNKKTDESNDSPDVYSNLENDALEQISATIIQKFKGYDMQKVIASIFRAKGYETYVSKGADKGIDVLASNGPLGFGGTKICIQVKTEDSPIGQQVLVELVGTMNNVGADYGLLVSWSGFVSSIESDKRDRFFKIKFWDHKDIVREFLDNYDKLDDWIKAKVPLKKIWVPEVIEDIVE